MDPHRARPTRPDPRPLKSRSGRLGTSLGDTFVELSLVALVVCGLAVLISALRKPRAIDDFAARDSVAESSAAADPIYDMVLLPDGEIALSTFRHAVTRLGAEGRVHWAIPRHELGMGDVALAANRAVAGAGNAVILRNDLEPAGSNIVLGRSPDVVRRVAVSANGRYAASTTIEGATCVWDLKAGERVQTMNPQRGWACADTMGFSPDGSILARGAVDRIELIQVPSGELLAELPRPEHAAMIQAIAISSDGRSLAESDVSGRLVVWNVLSRTILWVEPQIGHSAALDFTPDAQMLAAGTRVGELFIYEAAEGKLHALIEAHRGPITVIRTTAQGEVVTAGHDGYVRHWDLNAPDKSAVRFEPSSTWTADAPKP